MIEKNTKKIDIKKIKQEILELKKTLLNFKFQKSTGQLEKTSNIRKTRKDIARLKFQLSKSAGAKNA